MNEHSKYGYWVTHPVHNPKGAHNTIPLTEADKRDGWKEVVLMDQQPATKPVPDNRVPEAWTNVLAYVLQDDLCNRTTPRITDIAYNAFLLAKRPNDEDGGASDWFNDTKPKVNEMIAKLRKDLSEELPGAPHVEPNAKPLNAAEFEVDTYSPRGNGGFSRRSEVAVRIKHIPTGIETGSGGLRSQHANKQRAWELMQQALSKTERHYGPLRDADAEWGKKLSVYATLPHATDTQQAPAVPVTVEQVEDAIGLQSTAWDTIGAEKIVEAVLRLANGQAPAGAADNQRELLEDAAFLLRKYRRLCVEIGRGDSQHLDRIEAAAVAVRALYAEPNPTAQAADSVLEDAARWQWLVDYLIGDRTDLDEGIVACATIDALRQFVDAARKQGGQHGAE